MVRPKAVSNWVGTSNPSGTKLAKHVEGGNSRQHAVEHDEVNRFGQTELKAMHPIHAREAVRHITISQPFRLR